MSSGKGWTLFADCRYPAEYLYIPQTEHQKVAERLSADSRKCLMKMLIEATQYVSWYLVVI